MQELEEQGEALSQDTAKPGSKERDLQLMFMRVSEELMVQDGLP